MSIFPNQSYPMKMQPLLLALASICLGLTSTYGTTVIPPTFDELVSQAELIFQGEVTGVQSQWVGEGAQRHIVSYVTFNVEDPVKGAPGGTYTLRMLGGTVDGETMEVADSPQFKAGDRDIVFVQNNGSQFVPLVGIMHGRFHVQNDEQSGREIVTTNEREPLKDVAKLGRSEHMTAAASEALSPSEFKSAVRNAVQEQAKNKTSPN